MIYVVQTFSGEENRVKENSLTIIEPEILTRCFIPLVERKRKLPDKKVDGKLIKGGWCSTHRPMCPGYVFMEATDMLRLYVSLHKIEGLTKIVRTGTEIEPLNEDEEAWLMQMGGEYRRLGETLQDKNKIPNTPQITNTPIITNTTIITPPQRDEDLIIKTSIGEIKDGKLHIMSGPLQGREAQVKWVDKHHRAALLQVFMLGEMRDIKVGLEIVGGG